MKRLLWYLPIICLFACSKISNDVSQSEVLTGEIDVISKEEAIQTLEAFLNDSGMIQTKSGSESR